MKAGRSFLLLPLVMTCLFVLGGCRDPEKQLDSPKPEERVRAIREVALRDTAATAARLAPLAVHEDAATAQEAVRALGRMHAPQAAAVLRDVMAKEQRPDVRVEVVTALAHDPAPETAAMLREAARSETDSGVRAAAAAGLGQVGEAEDVRLLIQLVDSAFKAGDILTESRAFGAIENLCRVRFGYDSRASQPERFKAIERMKKVAYAAARESERRKAQARIHPPAPRPIIP